MLGGSGCVPFTARFFHGLNSVWLYYNHDDQLFSQHELPVHAVKSICLLTNYSTCNVSMSSSCKLKI